MGNDDAETAKKPGARYGVCRAAPRRAERGSSCLAELTPHLTTAELMISSIRPTEGDGPESRQTESKER